jgi:hypothetical protein
VKRAIGVAPFGELADPRVLASLTVAAEDKIADQARVLHAAGTPFNVITEVPPDDDPQRGADAGASWVVTDFDRAPREPAVRDFIKHGWR